MQCYNVTATSLPVSTGKEKEGKTQRISFKGQTSINLNWSMCLQYFYLILEEFHINYIKYGILQQQSD